MIRRLCASAVLTLVLGWSVSASAAPVNCPGTAATTDREFTLDTGVLTATCYQWGTGNLNGNGDFINGLGYVTLDKSDAPARLAVVHGVPPAPERPAAGIEIDITCGYGDASADVPEPLRQAIRLLVAHWYENRGLIASGGEVAALPQSAAALIAPYRVLAL